MDGQAHGYVGGVRRAGGLLALRALQGIYAQARIMEEGSYASYNHLMRSLRCLSLSPREFEAAARTIADILRV